MKHNGKEKAGMKQSPDETKGEVIDGQTGKPADTPKEKRRIDLSTLRDVRLELAAVYRKMDSGEIESQEGTRRAYVLKTVADVITLAELEKRIDELESQQGRAIQGQRALPERTLN